MQTGGGRAAALDAVRSGAETRRSKAKRRASCSGVMPIPVSVTSKQTLPMSGAAVRAVVADLDPVDLMALPIKLIRMSRSGRERSRGKP